MEKLVYIARQDSQKLQQRLREKGIPFVVKDGPYVPELLVTASALVPGKLPVTAEVLAAAPKLEVIAKYGVGIDRIDIPACTTQGVLVCNSPLVNCTSVAEHALTLLLMAAKQVAYHHGRMQQSPPLWRDHTSPKGIEVCGKTLVVIGLGHIGRTMARLCCGLDMRIVGYDPYADRATLPSYITVVDTLHEALSAGDFISIHVAGNEHTRGMIGEKELACMKPSSILINTTRGFVVDEKALADALEQGVIAGAAVDVIETEPVAETCPLLHKDNVVVTPHCAANTVDAHLRAEDGTADNIIQVFEGIRPQYAANDPLRKG